MAPGLTRRGSFEARRVPVALAALALAGLALWPLMTTRLAARRAAARVAALETGGHDALALCDPALSLRMRQLGPLLAGWETIGGCGAGGATDSGAGVRWMGHNTTGGLFNSLTLFSFINHFHTGSYDVVANEQLTRDFTPKLNAGVIVPVLYKVYKNFGGLPGDVTNSGIGDMALVGSYKLGPINATTVTAKLGLPTGTWNASYMGTVFTPDQQLGFGKVTGGLILEHTFDQTWGVVLVGGSANYRGGSNGIAYRGPGAVAYGFAGYFVGPLVPAVGVQIAGLKQQDTRGAFGENLDSPVLTSALNASIEWSTEYVAVLVGTSIPLALQDTWGKSGKFAVQPYIIGLGVSVSPF